MRWLGALLLIVAVCMAMGGCGSTNRIRAEEATTTTVATTTEPPTTTTLPEAPPASAIPMAPSTSAKAKIATGPGDPNVYAQIAAYPTCSEAQSAFDRFDLNHTFALRRGNVDLAKVLTTYMTAADERLHELHCPGI